MLSSALARLNKKRKIIGIFNGHAKCESYINVLNTMLIGFLLPILILSLFAMIEQTNLKKSYSGISEKHDQTSITLTNIFDLIG